MLAAAWLRGCRCLAHCPAAKMMMHDLKASIDARRVGAGGVLLVRQSPNPKHSFCLQWR